MPGFQILTRCSLFRADMLFFLESKCITSIVQKTGIIHLFEFKHSTSTSQTDKESYFVLLNVEAVQFLVTKNLAVNHFPLDAPPAVQTWTLNCWNATQDCSLLTFSGLLFVVFHEKPYRKSIIVIPENHDTWNILKMFICFPVWTVSQGNNPLFLKYVPRLDKPPQRVTWAISYVTSCMIHKKPTSYSGIFSDCGNQHQGVI